MNLEQIAQQAMSYLDSVGVAAEYEVVTYYKWFLFIPIRKKRAFIWFDGLNFEITGVRSLFSLVNFIERRYITSETIMKLKSPN